MRGSQIGMIFQEPVAALNPVFTIESQMVAAIRAHARLPRRSARDRAVELLGKVGIPDAGRRLRFYPHQLSGGLCQRVMIAMALAGGARLLIADEPTTALDVTVQEEIVRAPRRSRAGCGHRRALHLARSRRRRAVLPPHRGRLCGAADGARHRGRAAARALPSLYEGARALRAEPAGGRRRASRHSGGAPVARKLARGMPVRGALRHCGRRMRGAPAPARAARCALGPLLEGRWRGRRAAAPRTRSGGEHRHPASGHPQADGDPRPVGVLPAGPRPRGGGADGRLVRHRARPDPGADRGIRLRQVHGGAGDLRPRSRLGGDRSR